MYKLMCFGYCLVLDIVWIVSDVMDTILMENVVCKLVHCNCDSLNFQGVCLFFKGNSTQFFIFNMHVFRGNVKIIIEIVTLFF